MNYLADCAVAIAIAVPTILWGLQSLRDPEVAATQCYKSLMKRMAVEQMAIPRTRDAGKMVLRLSPKTLELAGECKERLNMWAKRDGEKLVNQKLAHVALVTFAENTTDPIAKMLVMQKVREIEASIAKGEWAQ